MMLFLLVMTVCYPVLKKKLSWQYIQWRPIMCRVCAFFKDNHDKLIWPRLISCKIQLPYHFSSFILFTFFFSIRSTLKVMEAKLHFKMFCWADNPPNVWSRFGFSLRICQKLTGLIRGFWIHGIFLDSGF